MSHNITLNISDKVYLQLMQTLNSFSKDEVEIVSDTANDEEYDEEYYMRHVPPSVIVSSVEELEIRLAKAEKSIAEGDFLSEEEYEKEMDIFMEKLLSEDN